MALTWKEAGDNRYDLGQNGILQQTTLTPAASDYVTGGYAAYSSAGSAPYNAGQYVGLGVIHGIMFIGFTGTAGSYVWGYNKTTCKIQVFQAPATGPGALVEVPAGTDLSGGVVTALVFGF